jgi:hypothetical protein
VLGVFLVSGFMVESVWGLTCEVSTLGSPWPGPEARLTPMTNPRVHPLEVPFVWFAVHLVELALLVVAARTLLPDELPDWTVVTLWVAALVGVWSLNYAIRRRFLPH